MGAAITVGAFLPLKGLTVTRRLVSSCPPARTPSWMDSVSFFKRSIRPADSEEADFLVAGKMSVSGPSNQVATSPGSGFAGTALAVEAAVVLPSAFPVVRSPGLPPLAGAVGATLSADAVPSGVLAVSDAPVVSPPETAADVSGSADDEPSAGLVQPVRNPARNSILRTPAHTRFFMRMSSLSPQRGGAPRLLPPRGGASVIMVANPPPRAQSKISWMP